jgi:sulfur carrier protein
MPSEYILQQNDDDAGNGLMLIINGRQRKIPAFASEAGLIDILQLLGVRTELVAIARNELIVPKAQWAAERIVSGDRLEIVHFVGGG